MPLALDGAQVRLALALHTLGYDGDGRLASRRWRSEIVNIADPKKRIDKQIEIEIEDSFPASDPPSHSGTTPAPSKPSQAEGEREEEPASGQEGREVPGGN